MVIMSRAKEPDFAAPFLPATAGYDGRANPCYNVLKQIFPLPSRPRPAAGVLFFDHATTSVGPLIACRLPLAVVG